VATRADVVVLGLGATGSAALLALARRGVKAIGFDRLHPPHDRGSTHGRSRIIREAYYESPVYVPLVQRAAELWTRLARESERRLFWQTGGLMIGPPEGVLVTGATRSAREHGIPFELLDAPAIRRRFPAFGVADTDVALLEHRAGFLDPEACVESALALAARAGAEIRTGTEVLDWAGNGGGLEIRYRGGVVQCGRAIVALGPWLPAFLREAGLPLLVERQVMFWFRPGGDAAPFTPGRMPVFLWEWRGGRFLYGVPDHGMGVKVACHHEGVLTPPDLADRSVAPEETAEMQALLARTLPGLTGAPVETATCLYTNTPDQHFVLGPLPADPRLLVASPCSGHGFKFASAVGEALADLATIGTTRFDLSPFRPERFGPG
jgi:sarcosine oxidase